MNVNKEHYRKLIQKQSFDVENTIFNAKNIDFEPFDINLEVYDE